MDNPAVTSLMMYSHEWVIGMQKRVEVMFIGKRKNRSTLFCLEIEDRKKGVVMFFSTARVKDVKVGEVMTITLETINEDYPFCDWSIDYLKSAD